MSHQITPRWLTLGNDGTAKAYCGLSDTTIKRAIRDGLIKSHIVNGRGEERGRRLIDRESLDAWIERRTELLRPSADSKPRSPMDFEALLEDLSDRVAAKVIAAMKEEGDRPPVNIHDAAKMLGVCEKTVRRNVSAGRIQRVPHVGRILIPFPEIKRLQGTQ